jgi:hypothetical protein
MTTSNPPATGAGTPGPGADEAFRAEVPHQAGVGAAAGGGDVAAGGRRELDGEYAGAPLDRHLLAAIRKLVIAWRRRTPLM